MTTKEAVIETIRQMPEGLAVPAILHELGRRYRAEMLTYGTGTDAAHYGIETISVVGVVDASRRLIAELPVTVPVGPAKTVVVLASDEELSAAQWSARIGQMWALDWDDPREVSYEGTEPPNGPR